MNDNKLWLEVASRLFLLPLIENENGLKWLNKLTIGIYTSDTNKPNWDNKILICYDSNSFPTKLKVRFKNNQYSYAEYTENIDGRLFKIIAFSIPPERRKDFNHILNGEYTKISTQTRNLILNHWGPISSKAREIALHFMNGHTHIYKTRPKLKDAILNLNNVPIKKADINPPSFIS